MRYRQAKRALVALGYEPFTPTDEQRHMVRIFTFNGMEPARIAMHLSITEVELKAHFWKELELSNEAFLGESASSMVELARQRHDLGVALRANEAILKTRLKIWREPKQEAESLLHKKIDNMSLEEVQRELERVRRARGEAATEAAHHPPGSDAIN